MTPLKRATRTPARGAIGIQVMPMGSPGMFCLLYLPRPQGPGWSRSQVAEDLIAAASALRAMFLEYGFSAKKTSGWGIVQDAVAAESALWARGPRWPREDGGAPGTSGASAAIPVRRYPVASLLALDALAGRIAEALGTEGGGWLTG